MLMTLNAIEKFESLKITGSFKTTSFKFKLGVNSGAWDSILTNVNISVSQGEEIRSILHTILGSTSW